MNPRGRVVLLTGASSGIGAAAARRFAAAGADLVLVARSADKLATLAGSLPGRPLVLPADISDQRQVQALVDETIAAYKRIDLLINNAGVGIAGPVAELDSQDFEKALQVDLFGPLYAIQAVLPHMQRAGRGQIINVSSVVARHALPYLGGYAAAKAALDRLSEALRIELIGSPITVTMLRPGTTRTGFSSRRLGRGSEQRRGAPRGVPPETVAAAMLRAARREPRVAYVSLSDRLRLIAADLLPGLTDRILAQSFSWKP
jgi:short-subunit dehydrogenase